MNSVIEAPQVLQALSTLLARAFGARSVHDISDAVLDHMREAMPAHGRDATWLGNLRRQIAAAARDVCLATMPQPGGDDTDEGPPPDSATATAVMKACLESAAAQMDAGTQGALDGRCLRSAADALVEAARGIPARVWGQEEHAAVREAEVFGAPPCMLFRLGGGLLWVNAALTQLCNRSETPTEMLLRDAAPIVRRMAASSRALGGSAEAGLSVAQLGTESGVHMRAVLRAGRTDPRAMLIEIVASQARRETRLTPRELQVATRIARHGSYRRVAEETGISLDSVRTYVRRVYKKLAINSRSQLRARLIHEGLFADDGAA